MSTSYSPPADSGHPIQPEFFTVPELAERLRLAKTTIFERIAAGDIEVRRFGRAVRVPRAECERLASQGF